MALLTGCGSVSLWPSFLVVGMETPETPGSQGCCEDAGKSPAALIVGAGPERAPNRCRLVPLSLGPTPAPGAHRWLWVGKSPHLVLTIRLFFSICPKEAPVGAPKQEEEKGASCLLSPVGRDWSWPGKHGVADTESIGAWWWEMFSLSRDRKLLLYWVQSAQWVAGRVCAGHPHSLHPFLLQTLLTPNKPPPISLPLSLK